MEPARDTGAAPRHERSYAPRDALPALTGLRFIAALVVVLFHYRFLVPGLAESGAPAARLIQAGYIGVSVFFVLSGFILAYTYLEPDGTMRGTMVAFWHARFARIYPAYALALAVSLPLFIDVAVLHPVGVVHLSDIVKAAVLTPTLLQAWTPKKTWMWDGPAWSLSAEAFFYALFPRVAVAIARQPLRKIVVIGFFAAICAIAGPSVYALTIPSGIWGVTTATGGLWVAALKFLPLFHLPEFVIGICTGVIFIHRRAVDSRRRSVAWITLLAAAAIAGTLAVSDRIPFLFLQGGVLALPFAVFIYGLAFGRGLLAKALSTRAAQVLGGASYSLYLLHVPLGGYLTLGGKKLGLVSRPGWGGVTVYVAVAIGAALAVFLLVEEPARRWLRARYAAKVLQAPSWPVIHPAIVYAVALAKSTSVREALGHRYGKVSFP
jgi:peptidoglycan/LPS O-acetylase OafA/YrhL